MRRHPAGKALPRHRAHVARSAASENILMAVAGSAGLLAVGVAAFAATLSDLDGWLRVGLLLPLAFVPMLVVQVVHGATDASRLRAWQRYYRHQALGHLDAHVPPTTKQRRTK